MTDSNKGRFPAKPILRREIEEAQLHTNSNAAAARYLGVTYERYRKYAKLYGIFDRHLNESGVGIDKGWSKKPTSIPLREILEGKHPKYSRAKLKNRLIARKKLDEVCSLCGFHEARITDGRVPLMLSYKDGNKDNWQLDNLQLLCYNCMFLTTGAPSAVYRQGIIKNLKDPNHTPYLVPPTTRADYHDPEEEKAIESFVLSDQERQELLQELEDTRTFLE